MSEKLRRRMILVSAVVSVVAGIAGGSLRASGMESVSLVSAEQAQAKAAGHIEFSEETLPNGLRVIYAPMTNAPVVHVRVLYHVGSRDERPDRQGFAHMFEHMMFRGSQHVAPEQHMKLITQVGGDSNAFTSFDQTTYINTLPSSHLEKALWLEADRMASFKVSDEIFQIERKVVAEEWRQRTANPPTGTLFQDFARTAFTTHSYRWTPIGDMDQLRQSTTAELQAFFNKYYVPSNACLIIAGDIDVEKTREMVKRFYGWIPKGPEVVREIPAEPEQTEARKLVVYRRSVPIPVILMGYKTTDYTSADHVALDAAGTILGSGRTSRLNRLLVNPPAGGKPVALGAGAGNNQLQDKSTFIVNAQVLPGNDADAVEQMLKDAVAAFVKDGPTAEELEKYKVQARQGIIRSRETAVQVATALGEAEVFGGDAGMVNREMAMVEALTPESVRDAAAKYLRNERLTVVQYLPDPLGTKSRADQAVDASKADETAKAGVVASGERVAARDVTFPADYPTTPPSGEPIKARLNQGVTTATPEGVQVVTLSDSRLPVVSATLVLRGGGDAEPKGKEGLASMTAQMLRRGSQGVDFLELAQELESRGVSVEVSDGNDVTRLSLTGATDQIDYAVEKAALVLTKPTFPESEFNRVKAQNVQGLRRSLVEGGAAASREMNAALWGDSPAGRATTPESLSALTLDDVKAWYESTYRRDGAFVVFSGDITPERATALASKIVSGLPSGAPPKYDYASVPTGAAARRIILVDNPDAKQANVRVGFRGYTLRSDERFAGNVASQVLSAGLDARMNKYLRAERGLTYGAAGIFRAGRNTGEFSATTDTNPATVGASVEGIFKVLDGMRTAEITDAELRDAGSRAAGSMVMEMQTVAAQAQRRSDTILNGWPADYFDGLPAKIAAVTKAQVQDVMKKYADPSNAVIVVVGPAKTVKEQLEAFGTVEVVPMPLARKAAAPAGGE